jgi:hypothetical protein
MYFNQGHSKALVIGQLVLEAEAKGVILGIKAYAIVKDKIFGSRHVEFRKRS